MHTLLTSTVSMRQTKKVVLLINFDTDRLYSFTATENRNGKVVCTGRAGSQRNLCKIQLYLFNN